LALQLRASQDQASELQTTVMEQQQHLAKLQDQVNDARTQYVKQQRDLLHAEGIATNTGWQNEGLQDLTFDRLKQMRHAAGADEKWLYIANYEENQGN